MRPAEGALVPRIVLLLAALIHVGCAGAAPLAPKAIEMNRLGIQALESGDLQTAEARFAVAIEYHPRFVEALVNMGLTELARGNHERALQLFTKARRINDDLPHPHHGLGVLAEKEGRNKDAADAYRAALKVDPGFVPSRANLARAYFAAGMLDDAREQFLRLTEVAAHDDRGPAGLVETLLRLGRDEEAREVLVAARRRLGDRPRLTLLVARALLSEGRTDEARLVLFDLASRRTEVRTAAKGWLAIADLEAGDVDGAVEHAESALAEDRHDPVATLALASALEAKKDPSAQAWKARARALAPH